MATLTGPLATMSCQPRQARKGATVATYLCAGVWLGWVATLSLRQTQESPGRGFFVSGGESGVDETSRVRLGANAETCFGIGVENDAAKRRRPRRGESVRQSGRSNNPSLSARPKRAPKGAFLCLAGRQGRGNRINDRAHGIVAYPNKNAARSGRRCQTRAILCWSIVGAITPWRRLGACAWHPRRTGPIPV